jgi:hypothetical protein
MLVSIIIPTHNRAQLLAELLFSIREQRYRPLEVVVVDDASTDNTQAIVEQFAEEAGRGGEIALIASANAKKGAQAARNQGIQLARGDALMFVDSDDTLLPDGIAKLAEALCAAPHVDYVYGKVVVTDNMLRRIERAPIFGSSFTGRSEDLAGYHWHTMGALYRKRCVQAVGPWNLALTGSQDWEYQARVKMTGGTGAFVDTYVGCWRQHPHPRVGADSFRPDYVDSAAKACCSIWAHALNAQMARPALSRKLAKRLLRHALEWGAAGRNATKQACIKDAITIAGGDPVFRCVLRSCALTPRWFDRLLVQITDARNCFR